MRKILLILVLLSSNYLFSQDLQSDYWENGQKVREGKLKDSLRDGKWRDYLDVSLALVFQF